MLSLRNVHVRYGARAALDGVSLDVAPGDIVAIIGPSGAGKSSLLRTLVGLEPLSAGTLRAFDLELTADNERNPQTLRQLRQRVGLCFQDFQLFPHLNVLQNVTLALELSSGLTREKSESRAHAVLKRVELSDFASRFPGSLSGGQKQRVALARVLALEPKAIAFDEPVSALDPESVIDVANEIRQVAAAGTAVILTTHHMSFARHLSKRVVFMVAGKIVEEGAPEALFSAPKSERLKQYLAHCLV